MVKISFATSPPHPELVEGRNNGFANFPRYHARFCVWLLKGGKDGRSKEERGSLGISSVVMRSPEIFLFEPRK
ncbi:hypothetical protein AB4Y96_10210 [Phyllobacterium sp. TAF24]